MAERFIMPTFMTPVMDRKNNRFSPDYHRYIGGIEKLAGRVAINVSPLGASPTNAEIATAFNALLTALQDAKLQETS